MKIKRSIVVLLGCLALLLIAGINSPVSRAWQHQPTTLIFTEPVLTSEGPVRGELIGDTRVYRGIPYAAPPIGELRWQPPQPAKPRAGSFDAVTFGDGCIQISNGGTISGSEDCLSLNIWAGKDSNRLPVMLFIHGGGNIHGASSQPLYDGLALSKQGVVVVTINFRLGPFGFLAHPSLSAEDLQHQSSGNYGILDQIAALQWLRNNIAGFGGDPNNITIFGESAGGRDVMTLLASPLAAGLFHKAIIESGTPLFVNRPIRTNSGTVVSAEALGAKLARAVGCDNVSDPAACLRGKSASELLMAVKADESGCIGVQYGPNVDGYLLPDTTTNRLARGEFNQVPVIIGTNRDEFAVFIKDIPLDSSLEYQALIFTIYLGQAGKVLARYPVSDYGSPRAAFTALITDQVFLNPTRTGSRLLAAHQPATYVYQFSHVEKSFKDLGAFHGLELLSVFNNYPAVFGLPPITPTRKDIKTAKAMMGYWSNFARAGNPNGEGLPNWPAYTLNDDLSINLSEKITINSGYRKDYCEFIDSLGSKLGSDDPTIKDGCGLISKLLGLF